MKIAHLSTTHTAGHFTWKKRLTQPGEEQVWDLILPGDLNQYIQGFCVKNYGGVPGDGFAGWKLVSGGPFDSAGAYYNAADAMEGVSDWLMNKLTLDVATRLADAKKKVASLEAVMAYLNNGA